MRCLEVDAAGLLGNQIFLFASGTGIAAELNASLCLARPPMASGKHLLAGVLQGQQPCCLCVVSACGVFLEPNRCARCVAVLLKYLAVRAVQCARDAAFGLA